ncbi:hypothetical protein Pyn_39058 [Prunus yedoensis var. nudiflora]|uniref:Uncharacterized protein n=1 Tax=Prunus yedoensis var. nudiflora TaxID=2094558 RepID=A0A314XF70_PRUYE|nr:hypothetical protein Pyn_39058 [Prunus yedoensis var. nudiflora]
MSLTLEREILDFYEKQRLKARGKGDLGRFDEGREGEMGMNGMGSLRRFFSSLTIAWSCSGWFARREKKKMGEQGLKLKVPAVSEDACSL